MPTNARYACLNCAGQGYGHGKLKSTFDANHLFQRVQDVSQIILILHDLINILVGSGNLINDPLVLATDYAGSLLHQIGFGKLFLGSGSTHSSTGTMRT